MMDDYIDRVIADWRKGLDDRGIVIRDDSPSLSYARRRQDAAMDRFRLNGLMIASRLRRR
jgi:hypothetical protein